MLETRIETLSGGLIDKCIVYYHTFRFTSSGRPSALKFPLTFASMHSFSSRPVFAFFTLQATNCVRRGFSHASGVINTFFVLLQIKFAVWLGHGGVSRCCGGLCLLRKSCFGLSRNTCAPQLVARIDDDYRILICQIKSSRLFFFKALRNVYCKRELGGY